MKKQESLQTELLELARHQVELERQGGPGVNGNLFEEILEIQDALLQRFGLPVSPDYESLLWFQSIPSTTELEARVSRLHSAASDYLMSNAIIDLRLLQEAQATQGNPMYVLPELKITTHTYPIFVFNEILLKEQDSVKNVLQDLRFCNQPEILDAVGRVVFQPDEANAERIAFLESTGVRYLQEFIDYNLKRRNSDNC